MKNLFGKKLIWLIVIALLIFGGALYFKSLTSSSLLWEISAGGTWFLPILAVAALVDSINPCAFSILLLTIAFLFSLGRVRSSVLKIGTVYILGLFLVYLGIGLGILQALHIFNVPHFMAKAGAIFLFAFGAINVLEILVPNFPIRLRIPSSTHGKMAQLIDKASMPTAFGLGALVGLCEFPCTGGPYLAVLGMLHDKSTFLGGLGYLLLYNLIFVLPLIVILLIASDRRVVEKVKNWQSSEKKKERLIAGFLMVGLAILFFLI